MPDDISDRLNAVKELTALFKIERMVYLGITVISLIMLIGSALSLMLKGEAGGIELSMLFGSSGLITYTAGRLLHMWTLALKCLVPDGKEGNE